LKPAQPITRPFPPGSSLSRYPEYNGLGRASSEAYLRLGQGLFKFAGPDCVTLVVGMIFISGEIFRVRLENRAGSIIKLYAEQLFRVITCQQALFSFNKLFGLKI